MIIFNDDDYGNPCDESNGNKANIKEWITKILLACVVIKTIIEIITLLIITIMILIVIIKISNSNL